MMTLVTAPNEDYSMATMSDNIKLFLGGGISNCPDWQAEMIEHFINSAHVTIYNPRREDFSPDNEEQQICWEFDKLSKADMLVFWFPKETVCPITLYELGKWGNSTKTPMVIGIEEEYTRKRDIIIQTELARPEIQIATDFDDFLWEAENMLKKLISQKYVLRNPSY